MKIALAQIRPARGDIPANIVRHLRAITLAVERGAEFIAFPELSLTGYEPELARDLAVELSDPILDGFQQLSDRHRLGIAVGVPTRATPRPRITLAIFSPQAPRSSYSKRHLHAHEEPYFTPGLVDVGRVGDLALAICYEATVQAHARAAFQGGAKAYLASVATTAKGVEKAHHRMEEIALEYSSPVLMVNCVGPSGDGECAGSSAAWNRRGENLGCLDATGEGLLIVDTVTERPALHCTWCG